MKFYEEPLLEVLIINFSDIITTSPGNVEGDNEFEDPFA